MEEVMCREERDCTKWAKERIREIITGAQLTHGDVAMFGSVAHW